MNNNDFTSVLTNNEVLNNKTTKMSNKNQEYKESTSTDDISNIVCSVVHCKKEPYDIYIGRPSKWGNPFSHKADTKASIMVNSRDEAVYRYKEWIIEGEGKYLLEDLHELKGKVLGCWCHPQLCHGDVLSELVNEHYT